MTTQEFASLIARRALQAEALTLGAYWMVLAGNTPGSLTARSTYADLVEYGIWRALSFSHASPGSDWPYVSAPAPTFVNTIGAAWPTVTYLGLVVEVGSGYALVAFEPIEPTVVNPGDTLTLNDDVKLRIVGQ